MEQIFALDLGTTKFCLATLSPQDPTELDAVCIPASGMKKGMMASFQEAKAGLSELVTEAEHKFSTDIQNVHVGIAGAHLWSRLVTTQIPLDNKPVSKQQIQLLEKQIPDNISLNLQVLHQIPTAYQVDQRPPVSNPIGLTGKVLQANYLLIGADSVYSRDIINLCNESGLRVKALFAEPFASAQATLNPEACHSGITIADIGGGTTDGICFKRGLPIGCFTINVGGEIITNDLVIGLGISKSEAEFLKHNFGIATSDLETQVTTVHKDLLQVQCEDIKRILQPRVQELAELIDKERIRLGVDQESGLFLTGGGADLKGICNTFEETLQIKVSKTRPSRLSTAHSGKYATSIGLLSLAQSIQQPTKKTSFLSKYAKQFFEFIREIS